MKPIRVLSLFDGMSCGQIALKNLGIPVEVYYASEIDKHAISVTMHNFPDTIQLGDVKTVNASDLPEIDLLIGGSPCQGFSFAGKQLAFDDPRSVLFFEFVRIWEQVYAKNPDAKFLLENVKMKKDHENVITRYIGVEPIEINSALVSAQNRVRLYWTNIYNKPEGIFGTNACAIPQPDDKGILLRDILEGDVDEKYYLTDKMISGLHAHSDLMKQRGNGFRFKPKEQNEKSSTLTSRYHKQAVTDTYVVASRGRNPYNPTSEKSGLPLNSDLNLVLTAKPTA